MRIVRSVTISVAVIVALLLSSVYVAVGQDDWITVLSQEVEVNFPDDVVFTTEFTSSRPLESVALSFQIVGRESSRQEPATLEQEDTIKAEYMLKTRGGNSLFIPPGPDITYFWIFEDIDGNTTETPPETFIYMDTRFDWQVITKEMVSVYYHGPVETRARTILDTAIEALDQMGELLETELTEPIRLIIYNNPVQMQAVLPFVSKTTSSGLMTLGQAYSKERILLLMAFASRFRGNTSHEVTHLLIAQAAEGPGRLIPAWLNEGLAEYGNIEPGFSYDQALLYSIRTGRLLPITHMTTMPGTPEDAILVYGQSRQIIKFMIDTHGPEKIAELLREFKDISGDIDDALEKVYGFDRVGLDNRWRESIGLPPLPEPKQEESITTPTPRPTFVPFGAKTPTPAIPPTTQPSLHRGDMNGDSLVDINDLVILRSAYGSGAGDPAYLADADLNRDRVVNYIDLAMLGAGYTGPE